MRIKRLESTIKISQVIAYFTGNIRVVEIIQNRLIILINEDDDLLTSQFCNEGNQIEETLSRRSFCLS